MVSVGGEPSIPPFLRLAQSPQRARSLALLWSPAHPMTRPQSIETGKSGQS